VADEIVCPRCGGKETQKVGEWRFECTTPELVGVVPPSGPQGQVPVFGVCGHLFKAGPSRCLCGRYAIGTCARCSKPLCSLHGAGRDALLCANCRRRVALEQLETKRRRPAEETDRLERVRVGLAVATDPGEIVGLLTAAGRGKEWVEPCQNAWRVLVESETLPPPQRELVRMRFRKPRLGSHEETELWRRPGWSTGHDDRRWWLDVEAGLWREEVYEGLTALKNVPAIEVGETHWNHPNAWVKDAKHLEKTFLCEPAEVAKMKARVVKSSDAWGRTKRHRHWRLSGGGTALEDWTGAETSVEIIIGLVKELWGPATQRT
jgi:hypothetical protein